MNYTRYFHTWIPLQAILVAKARKGVIRVLPGSSEKPLMDVERFLSMVQFDSREKLEDLMRKAGE